MSSNKLGVNKHELTSDVEARIIEFMKRFSRQYVYCGEIAVHMHNNLAWTSWALEDMMHRGVVHKMSDEEKVKNAIDVRAYVFTLLATK